ncbi:MAG: DnaJ C-terminal domain-containing protein, partial [Chloroflexota bacterium]
VLDVAAHAVFQRDGFDIYFELPLNVSQAALGDDVTIPTVDGEMQLHVPAGTQAGKTFPFRGKGVPHLRSTQRGAMYVVTRVVTPTKLTARQRELFEELSQELGDVQEEDRGIFEKLKGAFGG